VRRSRLRPVSEKKLAAAGGVVFSTFAKKPVSTGPHRDVVDLVLERDQHSCAWCGGCLWGDRGMDWSIGHRRPRRSGGDPRPDKHKLRHAFYGWCFLNDDGGVRQIASNP
jgi:hypothetical protein